MLTEERLVYAEELQGSACGSLGKVVRQRAGILD